MQHSLIYVMKKIKNPVFFKWHSLYLKSVTMKWLEYNANIHMDVDFCWVRFLLPIFQAKELLVALEILLKISFQSQSSDISSDVSCCFCPILYCAAEVKLYWQGSYNWGTRCSGDTKTTKALQYCMFLWSGYWRDCQF